MRIIFLDFDGVICVDEKSKQFSPDCMERLKRIVKATDSRIVVSSTWRKMYSVYDLEKIFGFWDLAGRMIGVTPDLEDVGRGKEITKWIESTALIDSLFYMENYIVIDDDDFDIAPHLDRLIKTDPNIGISEKDVEKAVNLLYASKFMK